MDAVKIIKKHGSPGGVPTITAYVADNAPGESEIHINVDNPQSVESLENIQYQGQTYVVPETPWIPTPTVGNAGKVLGVSNSGTYELQTPSGGGGGDVVIVNYTSEDNAKGPPEPASYTCDKTFSQITGYLTAGKPVIACINKTYFAFVNVISATNISVFAINNYASGGLTAILLKHNSSNVISVSNYSVSAIADS